MSRRENWMPSMICRLPVPNLEGTVSPKALESYTYGSTKVVYW